MSLADYAVTVLACDVTPHAPKQDGSKMPQPEPIFDRGGEPVLKTDGSGDQAWGWIHRQAIRPTEAEVRRSFSKPTITGFGIICGVVSGPWVPLPDDLAGPPAPLSLEMLEFEVRGRFDEFVETAHALGHGELIERVTAGYLSETPGGGVHMLIRSPVIEGNQKLARRHATPEELAEKPNDPIKVIAETRGQGGFTVEPPSQGSVHPSRQPYRLLRGGLSTIVTITAAERQTILDLMRSFNELPEDDPLPVDDGIQFEPATNGYSGPSGLDVIGAYNAWASWDTLMRGAGWKLEHQRGDVGYWSRPGRDKRGHSATTNYAGSDRLVVFTSSTKLEQTEKAGAKKAYSKFGFYAEEYHGGDMKAAVRAASDMLGMRGKAKATAGRVRFGAASGSPGDGAASPNGHAPSDSPQAPPTNDVADVGNVDEVAAAISQLQDLETRVKADPGLPFLPETLGALALLQEKAPAEWARQREALKRAGVSFRDLDKAIKQERVRRSGFRVVSDVESNEPAVRVAASMVPDAPIPQLVIPAPYFIRAEATGIVKQTVDALTGETERSETVIAHAPLLITGRLRDADEGIEALRLSWRRANGWQSKTVDRSVALNAQKLVTLADDGAPVTSTNAKDIVPYLDTLEAANYAQLPCARISSHLGWQGENGAAGFLVGRGLILPSGEMQAGLNLAELPPEDWREDYISFRGAALGDEQIADAYQARGTLDGWKAAVRPLAGHRRALLPFYGSFAAPVLAIIKAPNFIVDISNRTSTGKTTAVRAGASVWGNPDERSAESVIGSWDATRVWVERSSAVLHGLPLFLDDTKRAKDPKTVADTLYAVANGRGRGRGNPRGLAKTRAWRTILISTGEAPATSFTQDGGTRTRVLSIRGAPFGQPTDESRRMVDRLNLGVLANHGHAGPAFVRWLLEQRDEWDKLGEMYQFLVERYASEAQSAEGGRLAQYAAVIGVTAHLVHEALRLPWAHEDPLGELWAELAAEAEDAAGDLRALRDIVSWAYSHEETFHGRAAYDRDGIPRAPLAGWSGRWDRGEDWEYLGFFPPVLERVLRELGYEPAAILAGWAERDWLQADGDRRRLQKQVRVGGEKTRMYAIGRSATVEVDA